MDNRERGEFLSKFFKDFIDFSLNIGRIFDLQRSEILMSL